MTRSRPQKASKFTQLLAVLAKPKGASLETICNATGWQPHSARAAVSGLRKAGYAIERLPEDGEAGLSIYRIKSALQAVQ